MNKLLRPSISVWRHKIQIYAAAGISTNNRLWAVQTSNTSSNKNGNDTKKTSNSKLLGIIGLSGILGGVAFAYYEYEKQKLGNVKHKSSVTNDLEYQNRHRAPRKDLPTYKLDEILKHNSLNAGVWVTYGIGVYDITKFVPKHPGSKDIIMMAAGSAIDPFWNVYKQHETKEIFKLLETFRIGNIMPEDDAGVADLGSPWAMEPKRNKILKPASQKPFNAEPPVQILVQNYLTPNDIFYVRNHLPVPNLDEKSYELEVTVDGSQKSKIYKLEDIKKLPKHTVTAAIMCAGNRRSEMHEAKEVKGLSWGAGVIGNAKWTGAKLSDVLQDIGVKSNETQHVILEGYDIDPTSNPYGASIPLSKAMDERGDVILAYEMNDEPLNRDHGYPLRVIVPGVVGARNVKWIGRICVSDKESSSHWQQNDYKGFSPSTDWDNVDFTKSPAIQNLPVNSAICLPICNENIKVENGFITVKGYAWSGGGNKIIRIDLTTDQGKNWHVANIDENDLSAPAGRHYSWTLWSAKLPVDKELKEIEIWSKAVDSNYNVQPENVKNIWNLRGVLSNAYHRVKVNLI